MQSYTVPVARAFRDFGFLSRFYPPKNENSLKHPESAKTGETILASLTYRTFTDRTSPK